MPLGHVALWQRIQFRSSAQDLTAFVSPKFAYAHFADVKELREFQHWQEKGYFWHSLSLCLDKTFSWTFYFCCLFGIVFWTVVQHWIASAELFQLSPASLCGEMPLFGTVRHSHYGCVEDRSVHVLKFWGSTARCYSQLSTEHSYCHCVRAEQLRWKRGWISSS